MNLQYEVTLFDLDGTLVDTSPGITKSVQYALAAEGANEPDLHQLLKFIGPPLWQSFAEFYGFDDERCERAVLKYRERYSETGIHEATLYPGMDKVLRTLHEYGVRLATASSKPEVFVKQVLEEVGAAKYFDAIVGSEMDGSRSDKPELIKEALKRLGLTDCHSTVMVGDRSFDAIGAANSGVNFIGVLYGFGTKEELCENPATMLAESPEDILKYCLCDGNRPSVR